MIEKKLIDFENIHPLDINVSINITEDELQIQFLLKNNLIKMEPFDSANTKTRKLGLWKTTCFEFFVKNNNCSSYLEFNFSPEGYWNCFEFQKIGDKLKEFSKDFVPKTIVEDKKNYKYSVSIKKDSFPKDFFNHEIKLSASSVINDNNKLYYFSFVHPDTKPNFHHPDNYIISI